MPHASTSRKKTKNKPILDLRTEDSIDSVRVGVNPNGESCLLACYYETEDGKKEGFCCADSYMGKSQTFSKEELYNILSDAMQKNSGVFEKGEPLRFVYQLVITGGECLMKSDGTPITSPKDVKDVPIIFALKKVSKDIKKGKIKYGGAFQFLIHTSGYWGADPKIAKKVLGELGTLAKNRPLITPVISVDAYHEKGMKSAVNRLAKAGNKAAKKLLNQENSYVKLISNIMDNEFWGVFRVIDSDSTEERNNQLLDEIKTYYGELLRGEGNSENVVENELYSFDFARVVRSKIEPTGRASKNRVGTNYIGDIELKCIDKTKIINPDSILPCCSPFGYEIKIEDNEQHLRRSASKGNFNWNDVYAMCEEKASFTYMIQENMKDAYNFLNEYLLETASEIEKGEYTSACHVCSTMHKKLAQYMKEHEMSVDDVKELMIKYKENKIKVIKQKAIAI